jgi:hypothetical protein
MSANGKDDHEHHPEGAAVSVSLFCDLLMSGKQEHVLLLHPLSEGNQHVPGAVVDCPGVPKRFELRCSSDFRTDFPLQRDPFH